MYDSIWFSMLLILAAYIGWYILETASTPIGMAIITGAILLVGVHAKELRDRSRSPRTRQIRTWDHPRQR